MNKTEFKIKWLEALRSGKYKRGSGCLKLRNEYCCLGVAADIVDPTKWSGSAGNYTGVEMPDRWTDEKHWLPEEFWAEFGDDLVKQITLSELNDCGMNFKEISNFIDKYLHTGINPPDRDEILEEFFPGYLG